MLKVSVFLGWHTPHFEILIVLAILIWFFSWVNMDSILYQKLIWVHRPDWRRIWRIENPRILNELCTASHRLAIVFRAMSLYEFYVSQRFRGKVGQSRFQSLGLPGYQIYAASLSLVNSVVRMDENVTFWNCPKILESRYVVRDNIKKELSHCAEDEC